MSAASGHGRTAPRDRRTPVSVVGGACPLGQGCFCCPQRARHSRNSSIECSVRHPPVDRMCSPPWPERTAACPERQTTAADPPVPFGFRPRLASCCVECGRITVYRWVDSQGRILPWCAGSLPDPIPF